MRIPFNIDTLKMLFGGDYMISAVKHGPLTTVVNRTPVIVLTNDRFLFKKEETFESRMHKVTWEQALFLKECKGYQIPLRSSKPKIGVFG